MKEVRGGEGGGRDGYPSKGISLGTRLRLVPAIHRPLLQGGLDVLSRVRNYRDTGSFLSKDSLPRTKPRPCQVVTGSHTLRSDP